MNTYVFVGGPYDGRVETRQDDEPIEVVMYTQQQLSNQAYLARALQTNLPPQANDSGVDNTAIKREVKSANRAWLAKYNNEILELGKQAINV